MFQTRPLADFRYYRFSRTVPTSAKMIVPSGPPSIMPPIRAEKAMVQADGQNVEPVTVDELQMAVAETFDVIVEPPEGRAYTIYTGDVTARLEAEYEFREIDRLSSEMVRTGAPSGAVELVVVDADDRVVGRPNAQ